ncbi:hypothetical protein [Pseudarthrobacter polychromogenes]|uniref:O-antigen ligase n=1 Tax=Pseudarthrobacter polychromogenes TaxID=1676 RepID=A0ABQ1Y3V2_9MICC|nr:hypothetical protein [Pseudarthrobacter polychromogenes]GGH10859.1 hypothetical protein GCM10011577_39820 [Pseudarthrobacter polychromogenes]
MLHDNNGFRRLFGILGAWPLLSLSVPVATMLAALLLPVKSVAKCPNLLRWLLTAVVVGVFGLLVSAVYNGTALSLTSVSAFLVVGLLVFGFAKSTRDVATATQVIAWLSAASVVTYVLFNPNPLQSATIEGMWKYGIAVHVSVLLLVFTVTRVRRPFWTLAALLGLAAVSLGLGFRSHAIICLGVAVLILAKGWTGKPLRGGGLVVAVAGLGAMAIWVPELIESGFFGQELRMRSLRQTEGGAPALLGGRTEPPLSIAAIAERPWTGFGNSQAITQDTIGAGMNLANAFGMQNPAAYLPFWIRSGGVVSLHSILFGSWVDGGVLAAVLPILLIGVFALAIWKAQGHLAPIVSLVCAQAIWDLVFSPWASNRTSVIAASAVLAMWAIVEARNSGGPGMQDGELPPSGAAKPRLLAGGRR